MTASNDYNPKGSADATVIHQIDLARLRKIARGFPGKVMFEPAHIEEHDGECVAIDDRLVYVPVGSGLHDDDCYVLADQIEPHIGDALAELLNAVPVLLDKIAEMEKATSP